MLRLKVLLVAMGLWLAMGSMPVSAQGAYEIPTIAKLEQSCSGGNAADCDELGMRHLRGDGTAEDPKKAASYFQRACDRGDARGCFNLGDSYQFGDGVPKDPAKAAAFYLRACDGREKRGCSELALSYLGGNGVERSEAKAALYADRSCTLNSPFGCAILGMAYADGVEGYPQDLAKAKDLLSDACHQMVDYTKKPDEAARLACPALAKVTGEPACVTLSVYGSPTGEVRKHCFDAQAGWVTTVERGAAPVAARPAAPARQQASTPPSPTMTTQDNVLKLVPKVQAGCSVIPYSSQKFYSYDIKCGKEIYDKPEDDWYPFSENKINPLVKSSKSLIFTDVGLEFSVLPDWERRPAAAGVVRVGPSGNSLKSVSVYCEVGFVSSDLMAKLKASILHPHQSRDEFSKNLSLKNTDDLTFGLVTFGKVRRGSLELIEFFYETSAPGTPVINRDFQHDILLLRDFGIGPPILGLCKTGGLLTGGETVRAATLLAETLYPSS